MKPPRQLPSQDRLRTLLHYDPDTGAFVRRVSTGTTAHAGQAAGGDNGNGYWRISVDGRLYFSHRLAWVYVYGSIPDGKQVDHINGNPSDNRIKNLRLCDDALNRQNIRRARRQNKSGHLGVYLVKETGKFMAALTTDGKSIRVGGFETAEQAHAEYVRLKRSRHAFCTI